MRLSRGVISVSFEYSSSLVSKGLGRRLPRDVIALLHSLSCIIIGTGLLLITVLARQCLPILTESWTCCGRWGGVV
jgi:hypothetical protein